MLKSLRRHIMMQAAGGGLPSEYQEVEWIETDGVAYIIFPQVVTGDFIAGVRFFVKNYTFVPYSVFGYMHYTFTFSFGKSYYNKFGMNFQSHFPQGDTYATATFDNSDSMFWLEMYANSHTDESWLLREDTQLFTQGTCPKGDFPKQLALFYYNRQYQIGIKVSRAYVENIIDLVPCYRKSDGEVGVYDLVENTFYANMAGAGAFAAGPNVN